MRGKKWFTIFALAAAALLIAATVIWLAVLPGLIQREIITAFHDAGLYDISIEVRGLTFSKLTLQNLIIGKEKEVHIKHIAVQYDPGTLKKKRVGTIALNGALLDLKIKNGELDLGPLAEMQSTGAPLLAFEQILMDSSTLRLNWEGEEYTIPVKAVVEPIGADSVTLDLQAWLRNAPVTLSATININTYDGQGNIKVDSLNAELLQDLSKSHFQKQKLRSEGHLSLIGRIKLLNEQWLTELTVSSDHLLIQTDLQGNDLELAIEKLQTDLVYSSAQISRVNLRALLNQAPLNLNGSIDLNSMDGNWNIEIKGVEAEIFRKLTAPFISGIEFKAQGRVFAKGNISVQNGKVSTQFEFRGNPLSIQTGIDQYDLHFSQPELNTKINLAHRNERIGQIEGSLVLNNLSISSDSLDATVKKVSGTLPFSMEEKTIDTGSFTVENLQIGEHELPGFSGTFNLKDERLNLEVAGNILPEAKLEVDGWINLGEKITGEAQAKIPTFTIKDGKALAKRFPELNSDDLGGSFALNSQIKFVEKQPVIRLQIDIREALWKNSSSQASLEGITGTLTINSINPLATEGNQHVTLQSISFGTFTATNGSAVFRTQEDGLMLMDSIRCNWANGKLLCQNVVVEQKNSSANFELSAKKLSLQAILDFLDYQGVKGQGRIYGQLPVEVKWDQKPRITFGDGFLEARPQKGRLQFSKETARAILGIKKEIDPQKAEADRKEIVRFMLLRALQDMEYTKLRIVFRDEADKGWMTRIQVQGQGPYGDKENQIPIGGLDINISHLDDLLNSLIFREISPSRIQLIKK